MKRTLPLFCAFALSLAYAQENPVELYRGMGLHQHPIAANAEAQKYFSQGLVLLWGFNRYEARRSFEKAAELDPKAIMPQWGLAAANAPHINMDIEGGIDIKAACEAAKKAAALTGPEHERAYAKSALGLCQGEDAYRANLKELYRAYPDDLDAATLYAEILMVPVRWNWWKAGKPQGEMAECIRLLEMVLKRYPDHPGANHFYVHAIEMSPNPEYALPSAQRLMGGIAPGAGHLVHMAGHIYLRVGDYEIVAASNERASQVDEEYFHKSHVHGIYMGYYAHNLSFIMTGRAMQGRYEEANAAAKKLSTTIQPMVEAMPAMLDGFVPLSMFVPLRFHRFDEVLAMPVVDNPKLPLTSAMSRFSRALSFQGKGDHKAAMTERDLFEAARKKVTAESMWGNNKGPDMLSLASEQLAARLASSPKDAIPHWRKAVEMQDALAYDEPPPWYYPVRESLGAALLANGDAKAAEAVFREDLDRTPRNGRSLFGLWKALEAQNRMTDAAWVKAEFETAWKRAQIQLDLKLF